jgi:hypothetical protein
MTLDSILQSNSSLLGQNFSELGKPARWLRKKVFLAYDKKEWKVVRLNWFQRILRHVFGAYRSTHLQKVILQLKKYEFKQEWRDDSLDKRLRALWKKAYPNQRCPQYAIKLGNCPDTKQAGVICFAEKHTDYHFRRFIGKTITEHYRPGDIILVEGKPQGRILHAKDSAQTKYVNPDWEIQGWEPAGYSPNHDFNREAKEKVKVIDDFLDKMLKIMNSHQVCTEEEYQVFEREIQLFRKQLPDLVMFFFKPQEREKNLKSTYDRLDFVLKQLKEKEYTKLEGRYALGKTLDMIRSEANRAQYYNPISNKDQRCIKENYSKRNASMISLIQKYRKEGKKVFIIGGGAHFFTVGNSNASSVQKELSHHNNQIFVAEKKFLKYFKKGNRHVTVI